MQCLTLQSNTREGPFSIFHPPNPPSPNPNFPRNGSTFHLEPTQPWKWHGSWEKRQALWCRERDLRAQSLGKTQDKWWSQCSAPFRRHILSPSLPLTLNSAHSHLTVTALHPLPKISAEEILIITWAKTLSILTHSQPKSSHHHVYLPDTKSVSFLTPNSTLTLHTLVFFIALLRLHRCASSYQMSDSYGILK